MSLISELRRRNIFRVALLYLALAWLLLEIGALLVEFTSLPEWIFRFAFGLLLIGFPLALVFSWIFEITPEGLKREFEVTPGTSITRETGKRLFRAVGLCLVLIVLLNVLGLMLS